MDLFDSLKAKISGKQIKIVFPEGTEPRILGAAVRLATDSLVQPIVLGNPDTIEQVAQENNWQTKQLVIRDPETDAILKRWSPLCRTPQG